MKARDEVLVLSPIGEGPAGRRHSGFRRLGRGVYCSLEASEADVAPLVLQHAARVASRVFPGACLFGPSALLAIMGRNPAVDGVVWVAGRDDDEVTVSGLVIRRRHARRIAPADLTVELSDPKGSFTVKMYAAPMSVLDAAKTHPGVVRTFLDEHCRFANVAEVREFLWRAAQRQGSTSLAEQIVDAWAERRGLDSAPFHYVSARKVHVLYWNGRPIADLILNDQGARLIPYERRREQGPQPTDLLTSGRTSQAGTLPAAIEWLVVPGVYRSRRMAVGRDFYKLLDDQQLTMRLASGFYLASPADHGKPRIVETACSSMPIPTSNSIDHSGDTSDCAFVAQGRRVEILEGMFRSGLPISPLGALWLPVAMNGEGRTSPAIDKPWTHSLLIPGSIIARTCDLFVAMTAMRSVGIRCSESAISCINNEPGLLVTRSDLSTRSEIAQGNGRAWQPLRHVGSGQRMSPALLTPQLGLLEMIDRCHRFSPAAASELAVIGAAQTALGLGTPEATDLMAEYDARTGRFRLAELAMARATQRPLAPEKWFETNLEALLRAGMDNPVAYLKEMPSKLRAAIENVVPTGRYAGEVADSRQMLLGRVLEVEAALRAHLDGPTPGAARMASRRAAIRA